MMQMDTEKQPFNYVEKISHAEDRRIFLPWMIRLVFLAFPVSILQLVASFISLSHQSSNFHIMMIIQSFFNVIATCCMTLWAVRRSKELEAQVYSAGYMNSDVRITMAIFLFCHLFLVCKILMFINCNLQYSYVGEYLRAVSSDKVFWEARYGYADVESLNENLETLKTFFKWSEVFFGVYYLFAQRASYVTLPDADKAHSYLIYFSNICMLFFCMCGIWEVNHLLVYTYYPVLNSLNPPWNIAGIHITLMVLVFFSFVFWFIHTKRSRNLYFVSNFLILIFLVILVSFVGFQYRHVKKTHAYYLKNWHDRMAAVHESDFQSYGCPQKYLSPNECPENEWAYRWETGKPEDKQTPFCLNSACAGLLAQMYAEEYIGVVNYGFLVAVFLALVGVGFYYYWHVTKIDGIEVPERRVIWLGIMIIIPFLVSFSSLAMARPHIQEYMEA